MFDFLRNVRWSLLLIGLINIVIGIAMVMYPETASDTVVKIIGGIMAVAAAVSILGYFVDKGRGLTSYTNLMVGALMLIMGAILFFSPGTFVEFLGYIFAVIVLVQGINLIVEGISSRKYQTSHWGQTVLMGLICVALAVLVFINPFNTFKALMMMTGIALILSGLLNLFTAGRIGAAAHTFNKAVKEVEKGMEEAAEMAEIKAEAIDVEPINESEAPTTSVDKAVDDTNRESDDAKSRIPENISEIKLDFNENSEGNNEE